jgi:hypothetical protein
MVVIWMARLVWTDRGVRYFDPNPEDATEATIAFGKSRLTARLVIKRRKSGQGGKTIEEEEEVRVVKEKGKPALIGRVRRDVRSAANRSAQP